MAATGLEQLTENDIDEILSRLPTKDAVRTSVLSRSWRHRWKSIPDLDLSFIPIAAADKTLRLHLAPVRHLKFQIENRELDPSALVPLFDAIVRSSTISLRSIDISLKCSVNGIVRLSTFAQFFPRLTLIKLSACVIQKPHRTTIFPDLRTLYIADVAIGVDMDGPGHHLVPMYIPACPKLEKLSLELRNHCISRRDLDPIGRDFPRLTHLKLRGCLLYFVPSALATTIFPHLRTLDITDFSLYLDGVDMDSTGHLSFTMYIAACPKLEKLTLDTGRHGKPCHIDTFGLDFPRLTHLELRGCHLTIVPSALTSLRLLHLYKVSVHGKLSVLFSSCPSLEMLILRKLDLVAEEHLHVSAPNLRLLELAEVMHGLDVLRDFSIANSPALETVLFDLHVECYFECGSDEEDDEICNLMKVLGGLPRVKKLTLLGGTIEFLEGGLVQEKLPTSFEHLTHLSMDVDLSHTGATSVFCLLIMSAPNLQEVHLKWRLRYREKCFADRGDFWKERQHMDAFDNLKTVRMTLLGDDEVVLKFELEVIQFVLSKARVLEAMMIEFMYDDVCEESFMKKVLEFPKASHQAQIVFSISDLEEL